jgi:hypothetical protein
MGCRYPTKNVQETRPNHAQDSIPFHPLDSGERYSGCAIDQRAIAAHNAAAERRIAIDDTKTDGTNPDNAIDEWILIDAAGAGGSSPAHAQRFAAGGA